MRLLGRGAAGAAFLACVVASGCLHEATGRPPSPTPPQSGAPHASAPPRETFLRAVRLYDQGSFDAARPLFRMLLDDYPALADYHLAYLAALEERTGHPREALGLDERLLAAHPGSVWAPAAAVRRVRSALALGDPRAAELGEEATAVAESDPAARVGALAVRAAILAPSRPHEAYETYQAVRRSGGSEAAAAREACRALAAEHPELLRDPTLALAEGRLLASEGRLDAAVERLETAASTGIATDRAEALRALARAYQQMGRLEDAIATYRRAAAAEPKATGMARFDLASLLWNRDRDDEARPLFVELAGETPPHPKQDNARYALGRIAEHDGRLGEATQHYQRLAASGHDAELMREARWRLAWIPYQQGELQAAADAFAALDTGTSPTDRAASLYWRGRVLARLGRSDESRSLYETVLSESPDGYYADLAEQALGSSAPPGEPATPLSPEATSPLAAHAYHWVRSRELVALGMNRAAARELAALARELPDGGAREPALLAASTEVEAYRSALKVAQRLGSDVLPPSTVAAYQYPRAYWSGVTSAAAANRLDPLVVLALMRQESLFDADAVSSAAAYGLMQLLPSTATRVAGRPIEPSALVDPTLNVELGTRYLRQLLDRYDGNLAKALGAYNGGEDAVAKWERRAPGAATDELVETISFRETRHYVKQVLANYRRYRRLYGALGEQRAVDRADTTVYDGASASADTSFPASPPNPPFDISTITSPDAT